MSNLTPIEKRKLEKLFGMGSGYVITFSNRTFQEFIMDNYRIDIYDSKYEYGSGSKANRLRAFWNIEQNHLVGKLISDMLEYWREDRNIVDQDITLQEQNLHDECQEIADRLICEVEVENIDVLDSNEDDLNFSFLAETIRENIYKNKPEAVLDRLHTFIVRYVRKLCDKHNIHYDKDLPLHSLFGMYVKILTQQKIIESEMTERILKSSINILESFNSVRNNKSFAHDNPILNHDESILIVNYVTNAIKFIDSIENEKQEDQNKGLESDDFVEIPF